MSDALLRAEGVGRRFGSRRALHDVSLEVRAGQTLALIGPNGAGKTTLLGILAGALEPDAGRVERHAPLGFVPQRPALWRRLDARENLRLLARLDGVPDPDGAADRLVARAGLGDLAGRRVGLLSVGQQQRVNVAAGLLGDPRIVLLDEPTAALDPRQRQRLWELLAPVVAGGGAVVFTTQNVEEVAARADRLVVLREGGGVYAGDVAGFVRAAGGGDDGMEAAFVRFFDTAAGSGR